LRFKCNEAASQTKAMVKQSREEMGRGSDAHQQAASLGQVLEAMEQIQQASENTANAAQKGANNAASLLSQVEYLVNSVSEIEQAIDTDRHSC
jgi:methyl-accepting chemotaxis protein